MPVHGPGRYKAEKHHPSIRLGTYCTAFLAALADLQPALLDELDVLSDFQGYYRGLLLYWKVPRRMQEIRLELMAIEEEQRCFLDFNGAKAELADPRQAVEMLIAIRHDELVCFSEFQVSRLSACRLEESAKARQLLDDNRYESRGILDYILPAKLRECEIVSWSGALDAKSRAW